MRKTYEFILNASKRIVVSGDIGGVQDMTTSSNGNIFRVTGPLCGEFTGHRWIPVTKGQWRGALMFSLICALYKRLGKQSWGWWFETPSRSLWRHCNDLSIAIYVTQVTLAIKPSQYIKITENNASQWLWPRFVFWLWFDKACSTHMLQLIHQLWGHAP